jgi:MinD-like ATPase involved in chromosome partitioning or flagellar assembly
MTIKILFTAGAKGGTGKSTFLRYLITWFQDHGVDPLLIDADDENGTLKRFFATAISIEPRRRKAYDAIVNLVEGGKSPLTLVDLKAGVGFDMLNWFADVPFDELKELGVIFVVIIVVTSSPDSVSSGLRWVNFLGKRVKYIVVKNLKDSDAWEQKPEAVILPEYDTTKQALEFRKLYKPAEIVLPALDPEYQSELERLNLTIRDVLAKHPNTPPTLNSLIVRSKLRNYQTRLYDAFAAHKDLLLP